MSFDGQFVEQIVAEICNSESISDAFELYRVAAPLLSNYKFIFASKTGASPGFAVNRSFSAGAAVRSLFKTQRVLVLDAETAGEMALGPSIFQIDYSISLDTNAVSYLKPYMDGKRAAPIPADFQEVFDFIARSDVYFDALPYFTENLLNLAKSKRPDKIFDNLKAYETLRTLDVEWLREKGELRSKHSNEELTTAAQRQISEMYMDLGDAEKLKRMLFPYQFVYAGLLKMAAIQLTSSNTRLGKKMEAFLEFNHSRLATMSGREMAVAKAYFERGQKLRFFGKVQKGRRDILRVLSNMAWDMWHVRQLELSMTYQLTKGARYFFPALLTFDQRLVEIMDIYPLKAVAFQIGSAQPMPFFDGDLFKIIAVDSDGAGILERYFSTEAVAARAFKRDHLKVDFDDLIVLLEHEVIAAADVD